MFLGCGIIVVGPRRSHGRPGAKGFCGVGMKFREPKWTFRRKTVCVVSDDHPSRDEIPLTCASSESVFESLPEIVASFKPGQFSPHDLLRRYHERRDRERRSSAPSPELIKEEEQREFSEIVDKG